MFYDVINGLFEIGIAGFILMSIRQIYKDKQIKGVYWPLHLHTTAWGIWNLYFYYAVNTPWSWWGGLFVVTVNLWYLSLILYYNRKNYLNEKLLKLSVDNVRK